MYADVLSLSSVHVPVPIQLSPDLSPDREKYSVSRRVATSILLSILNMLNYYDRSIYGVVLPDISAQFHISFTEAGLLQTIYVVAIIVAAPFAGFLGRKFSRKWAIVLGTSLWATTTVLGPFCNQGNFQILCSIRAIGGLGQSFLGTLAVTMIADLSSEKYRPLNLNIFMVGIPLGGSSAYFIGVIISQNMDGVLDYDGWVWAASFAGFLGSLIILTSVFVMPDISIVQPNIKKPKLSDDFKYLKGCKTYILTVIAYTCFSFAMSAKQFWTVTLVTICSSINHDINLDFTISTVAFILLFCGWMGTIGTAEVSRLLKNQGFTSAQPLITGFIGIVSGLIFLGFIRTLLVNIPLALTLYGIACVCLTCWAGTTQDILMGVTPPFFRPVASGIATFTAHLLGDGFSPSIVGALSDLYQKGKDDTWLTQYEALQFGFYAVELIPTIGGSLFFMAALTLPNDLRKVKAFMASKQIECKVKTYDTCNDRKNHFAANKKQPIFDPENPFVASET